MDRKPSPSFIQFTSKVLGEETYTIDISESEGVVFEGEDDSVKSKEVVVPSKKTGSIKLVKTSPYRFKFAIS